MQNKPILFRIYFLAAAVALIAATAFRTLAGFTALDFDTGYFTEKLYIGIADNITVISVFLLLSYLFLSRKEENLILKLDSSINYVFSGILGCGLILFAYRAYEIFKNARAVAVSYREYAQKGAPVIQEEIIMYIAVFMAIFAIISSLYFLYSAIFIRRRDVRRADFGLVTVIFLALYSAYLYFNQATPINSPQKIAAEMAILLTAVFFLYETRISIGRERWRSYAAFGFISMLLNAYASIPALLIYIIKGRVIADSIYESVLCFILFLFVFSRLLLMSRAKEDKESPAASLIKKAAENREAELTPEPAEAEQTAPAEQAADTEEYYELNFESLSDEESTEVL